MRHRKSRLRLTQKPDHARLLQRNLVTSLLLYEAIRTTRQRAKVVQPIVDRLITTAKKQTPHVAIRSLNAVLLDKNASRKVMEVLTDRYKNRVSGFTTIKAVGARKGDGAQLVDLSLIDAVTTSSAAPAEKPKAAAKPKKTTAKKSASSDSSEK
ncbi:MAG TPA: 50S ribosomal protein L17 [Candidatus Peribacteraceae bacterium]|nr:50S ribosomal protein L17 [Candidatus Peribacteraceae bacterium]